MQVLVRRLAPKEALLHLSQTLRSALMTTAEKCKTAPHQPRPQPQTAGCQQAKDRAPARTWHHLKLCLQEALHLAVQHHLAGVMSAKALFLVTQVPPATMTQVTSRQHLTQSVGVPFLPDTSHYPAAAVLREWHSQALIFFVQDVIEQC